MDIRKKYFNGQEINKALINGVNTLEVQPKIIASDSFNRADSVISLGKADTGQTWLSLDNCIFGINKNRAFLELGGPSLWHITLETRVSDVNIEVDVTFSTGSGGGLIFRCSSRNSYLDALINPSGLVLRKNVAGTVSTMGSYSFTPIAKAIYHLKVALNGDDITVFLDGVQRISVTEPYNRIATLHGLRASPYGAYFDNFKVEGLA